MNIDIKVMRDYDWKLIKELLDNQGYPYPFFVDLRHLIAKIRSPLDVKCYIDLKDELLVRCHNGGYYMIAGLVIKPGTPERVVSKDGNIIITPEEIEEIKRKYLKREEG